MRTIDRIEAGKCDNRTRLQGERKPCEDCGAILKPRRNESIGAWTSRVRRAKCSRRLAGKMSHRGFSLTELMIAIAILGIGLLMVAPAFLVGINQAQQATNDTVGPIVANEAFAMVELLLKECAPRVGIAGTFHNLRDLLQSTAILTDMIVDPTGVAFDPPEFSINAWLLGDLGSVASGAPMPRVCAYPSIAPTPRGGHPYYWSMLYRFPRAPQMDVIEIVVFVKRRSTALPAQTWIDGILTEPVILPDGPHWGRTVDVLDAFWNEDRGALRTIDEGTMLVTAAGADFVKVTRCMPEASRIEIDQEFARPPGAPEAVLFIPRSANTGASPLIGVFKKRIRLR